MPLSIFAMIDSVMTHPSAVRRGKSRPVVWTRRVGALKGYFSGGRDRNRQHRQIEIRRSQYDGRGHSLRPWWCMGAMLLV
jgi:hypothetical protein